MNFEFSDDQKLFQKSMNKFFTEQYPTSFVRNFMEQSLISKNLKEDMAKQGLLEMIGDDEESLREGLIYSVLTSYEAGKALLPFPALESHLASYMIKKHANNKQLENQLLSGEKVFTVGWKGKETQVSEDEINTTVSFVPFASSSDYMMIHVRMSEEKNALLLIDLKNEDNVHVTKENSMDETYPLYTVKLDNYRLSSKNFLAEVEDHSIEKEMVNIASLLVSAEMIGGSEEILERTVNYTKERKQFGEWIAKFQAVKHQAADMYLLLESSKVALKYATWVMSSNQEGEIDTVIPILKSHVSESCNQLIGIGIQLHGGIGFTWESDVHFYYKRARRNSLMHGDIYYHREKLFQELLSSNK